MRKILFKASKKAWTVSFSFQPIRRQVYKHLIENCESYIWVIFLCSSSFVIWWVIDIVWQTGVCTNIQNLKRSRIETISLSERGLARNETRWDNWFSIYFARIKSDLPENSPENEKRGRKFDQKMTEKIFRTKSPRNTKNVN